MNASRKLPQLERPKLLPDGEERDMVWLLPSPSLAMAFCELVEQEAGQAATWYPLGAESPDEAPEAVVKLRYPLAKAEPVFFACYLVKQLYTTQLTLNGLLEAPDA